MNNLPDHALLNICRYLSFIDIENLSKTCKQLYISIEKDNYFWMTLIKNHFGSKLYQRYVHEIFHNKKNSDYVLYLTDKDKENFKKSFENEKQIYLCIKWLFNMLNGNENSDGYLAYKSVRKRKLFPRTNQLKMSLSIEQFFEYYSKRNQYFFNKKNILQIPFCKLIYSYSIEPKRLLGIDLFGIRLRYTNKHSYCVNQLYPKQESDINSLTGRCARLFTDSSLYLLGIKGKFQSILPGIYQITCRIKLDKNEQYLTYYNQCCSENPASETSVTCYFYALADHGLDCECSEEEMNFDWFESNYSLHGNQNWFNETMGQIKVFELSHIYFGFKIIRDESYRNVLFDYIQLNIIE
jgi:hypothetical protein